jgi:hypothetical protein
VHRPDWERHVEMRAWTQGDGDALVRFVAPAKDAGNATLKLGRDTSESLVTELCVFARKTGSS